MKKVENRCSNVLGLIEPRLTGLNDIAGGLIASGLTSALLYLIPLREFGWTRPAFEQKDVLTQERRIKYLADEKSSLQILLLKHFHNRC